MAEDVLEMTGMDTYDTEKNRKGMQKLYTKHASGSPVLSDAAAEYIILSLAVEDRRHFYRLEECLEGLKMYPDSKAMFMLTVCSLKHSKVFYYDEPEGDYPSFTCQPDSETGEMIYLLYSYKRRVPREYKKVYRFHCEVFSEMKDVIVASGCRKLALYQSKGVVLDVAEVLSCMDSMERACRSFESILEAGIGGEDLFELVVNKLDERKISCTLRDGTELAGKADNMSYVDEEDCFVPDFRPGEFRMAAYHDPDYAEEYVQLDLENYDPEDFIQLTDEIREKYVCPEKALWDRYFMTAGGRLYSKEIVYDPVSKSLVEEYMLQDYLDSLADIERVSIRTEDLACVKLLPPAQKDAEE